MFIETQFKLKVEWRNVGVGSAGQWTRPTRWIVSSGYVYDCLPSEIDRPRPPRN